MSAGVPFRRLRLTLSLLAGIRRAHEGLSILRPGKRRCAGDLPRVWHQPSRHRGQRCLCAAQAGRRVSCLRSPRRPQACHCIEWLFQLAHLLPGWSYCRHVSQREPAAESSVQCLWRLFRYPHAVVEVVACSFLASHRPDHYCPRVGLAQRFIFEMSMSEREITPPALCCRQQPPRFSVAERRGPAAPALDR